MSDNSKSARVPLNLKPKEFEPDNARPGDASQDPNDIAAVLRENHRRANEAGLNEVTFGPPRRSRRKRDYIIAMVAGNLALVAAAIVSPIFGGAGLVIYNVGLTWIVWGVMDDY